MKLSELIGAPVLDPAGKRIGYVKSIYASKTLEALASLGCATEEEEEFFVPARAVLGTGEAVTVGKARLKAPAGVPSPIGKAVFDCRGNYLGRASELIAEREGALLVRGRLPLALPLKSLAAGDAVILYPGKGRPAAHPKPRTSEAPKDGFDRFGLLGRRVLRPVFDRGELLAGVGETVTSALLKRAHARNRLLELEASTLA